MKLLKQKFSASQIKALLKKDLLIRLRQPWMTIVQFVWPCLIFLLLYSVRYKFQSKTIEDCQFPTRQLPSKNNILPFFHSYICTIENKCSSTKDYEEFSRFEDAPLKPIINIAQIFINDDQLFNALKKLPEDANFVGAVTTLATNSHFKEIQTNIQKVVAIVPLVEKMIGGAFDIKKLFSDRETFVKGGKIICGHPFPRTDVIRFVEDILYSEDFSEINDDELDAMPTPYCKKLYLDVTSSNNGKMTWSQIKPIIHGKILYGPENDATNSIMQYANTTFEELSRLQILTSSLHTTLSKLRTDEKFIKEFEKLIDLAKSPIVRSLAGSSVDLDQIEVVMNTIRSDATVYDVIQTIKNILECFSVDRFIPVNSEVSLRENAFDLNKKKLFYAGVFFDRTNEKDVVYKLHMDTDNTPVTLENKNRFWFPGPEGSMTVDMKYHRGFVQIKHAVDMGIIRYKKSKSKDEAKKKSFEHLKETRPTDELKFERIDNSDDDWFTDDNWDDEDNNATVPEATTAPKNGSSLITGLLSAALGGSSVVSDGNNFLSGLLANAGKKEANSSGDIDWDWEDDEDDAENTTSQADQPKSRQRRTPQFGGLLGLLFGGDDSAKKEKFEVDEIIVHTKQFPYPAYVNDDFKKGIYLAQAVQMAFFFGLMALITTCVRYRIWMRESRNTMLMRAMGLKESSEITAWILTTFVELIIIFVMALFILHYGGILVHTNLLFVMIFSVVFGLSLISFCYMCSTFFSSATVGSVSSAIFFLMSFMPYIVIICLDTKLSGFVKFLTNLSFTTAFCYAWDNIMRVELQGFTLSFGEAFEEGFSSEFTYAFCMIVFDTVLYAIIGAVVERVTNDEFKFHEVERDDLDINVGATLTNVSKIYNDSNIAVSNISMQLPKNQVTCLLGRNGAGKSTIIKMLTGQIQPTTGKVVLSQALANRVETDKVGLCSQDNILIPNLTPKEHLQMYAKIKLKNGYEEEVKKTMASMNFGKYENVEAQNLSGGYQRRLCVAIAFIGSPNVVILDEPCNGVDSKARKYVWDLVDILRKGRAVVLATHYLDEAEYLSDSILILNGGKVIAKHNPETMKNLFLQNFELDITSKDNETIHSIRNSLDNYLGSYKIAEFSNLSLRLLVNYDQGINKCSEFLEYLESLYRTDRIEDIAINSKNLEEVFSNLNKGLGNINGMSHKPMNNNNMNTIDLKKPEFNYVREGPLSKLEMIKLLVWKRLLHFSRNFYVLLCILVLPALFEIIAMAFMQLRPGDEFDNSLNLTRDLYPDTTEFTGMQIPTTFTESVYGNFREDCDADPGRCLDFTNSEKAFRWILETNLEYQMRRYGGVTFNTTNVNVWYNNKGYHSMVAWLNDLNSHMLQAEMNDSDYKINTFNHPFKLGDHELSTSSILQQVADSGVALILLVAFSLVVAGTAVFVVNERVNGEKLQQKLCGVGFRTYWGVAFVWDFLIYLTALLVCVVILKAFNIPVMVDKDNLNGICLLIVLYGFACITGVHLFEKVFAEASVAIMSVFCMNVFIALTTVSIVALIDIMGESDYAVEWRNFLNRAFLIFPQHALADGLIEISKNYVVAEMFTRFDIDSYKSPVASDLLAPHFASLISLGIIFIILNYILESGVWFTILKRLTRRPKPTDDLKIVTIQNSLKRDIKPSAYDSNYSVKVDNLYKAYKQQDFAVKDVTFSVSNGECFGLLGKNGAGKSTIFKILSGQMFPTYGTVDYFKREISYCPQTNALDPLLTVKELIEFYGKLRKVNDISKLISSTLQSFHLESYKNVLVKNLSGGNRRKLNVAVACIGRTSVVLMDEPTSDMDPVTRSLVYKAINDLVAEQRSVVLTSHTISEIEDVCHRIAVLKDGRMISSGSPEQLKGQYGGYYSVTIFCDEVDNKDELIKEIQKSFPACDDVQRHIHSIKFQLKVQRKSPDTQNGNSINQIKQLTDTAEITLADLFRQLNTFASQHSVQFTISRCRLDTVFQKILDTSDSDASYVHRGFVNTETTHT